MSGIWDSTLMEEYDFKFYWPVHDEIVISVSKTDAVPVIQKLHALMCGQFLDVLPSSSSIGIGDSFGNLNEIGGVPDRALIESALLSL
jgi:DNA polymerase I-like protein with 3'-5' exonuclease and polymerase domains